MLAGQHIVVTSGGTREAIDPVRYLGNRSSGKMGHALVRAALKLGARVTLISTIETPADIIESCTSVRVESAAEMHTAVMSAVGDARVLIMAAAVADYRPAEVATRKIKKGAPSLMLELVRTADILAEVATSSRRNTLYVVGFAAETDDPIANAVAKVREKRLDLIVVNDVSQPGIGMGSDDNAVTIIDANGIVLDVARTSKDRVAVEILDVIASRLTAH